MYDPQLGRFTCLDPIAESFYYVTPYNYAENDPVGAIDLWGLQKLKIAGNFSITTGKVGAKVNFADLIGIGGSISPAGGGVQKIELYVEINTETGKVNLGVLHSDKVINKESSVMIGPFKHGKSSERETIRDLSINNGATKTNEKVFKNKESGGIGIIGTKVIEDGPTKYKAESRVEVNALMVGVEIGGKIQYTLENETQGEEQTQDQSNAQKQVQTPTGTNDDEKYTKNQY